MDLYKFIVYNNYDHLMPPLENLPPQTRALFAGVWSRP